MENGAGDETCSIPRIALAGYILVAILLLLDISATILTPNLSVLGFPVGTIAMSILGL